MRVRAVIVTTLGAVRRAVRSVRRPVGGRRDGHGQRATLFPWGWSLRFSLVPVAVVVAFVGQMALDWWLVERYKQALRKADVVCDQLAAYGASAAGACEEQGEPDRGPRAVGGSPPVYLAPSDLSALMHAAGIVEDEERAEPLGILDLKGPNAAAWIAHAWIEPCSGPTPEGESARADAQPLIVLRGDGTSPSTIEAMLMTVCELGVQQRAQGCGDETVSGVCCKNVEDVVDWMAGGVPLHEVVKRVLGEFAVELSYVDEHGNVGEGRYLGGRLESGKRPFKLAVDGLQGGRLRYEAQESTVRVRDTDWGKDDPGALREAAFKFSYFLLTSVAQSDEVRFLRFVKQATVGFLQGIIAAAIALIAIIMLVRLVVSLAVAIGSAWGERLFWRTTGEGRISKAEWHAARESSGVMTGQMLDLLPLLGLFGTVLGILEGLPNAASVVVASGPLGTEAVKELFEQLGLAFGTTAIALLGVIVLQPLWTGLQRLERNVLDRLLD